MFNQFLNTGRMLPTLFASRSMSKSPMQGPVGMYKPNNLEKKFLLWTGKYKTAEEIPNFVSADVMERCRNKIRIRLANIMMGLTILGCIIMIYSGKEAAKRGETVSQQNIDWHKRYNELHGIEEKKQ